MRKLMLVLRPSPRGLPKLHARCSLDCPSLTSNYTILSCSERSPCQVIHTQIQVLDQTGALISYTKLLF